MSDTVWLSKIYSAVKAGGSISVGGNPVSAANPLPVTTPLGAPIVGQLAIAVTSTAIALGAGALANGVVIRAAPTNVANVSVGGAGVNTTNTGTGNGYSLSPGEAISFAAANLSQLYINGTAGDFVSYAGN